MTEEIEPGILIPDEEVRIIKDKEKILIPYSRPIVGVAGKTGSWRIFKPILHADKCIKCYFCYINCPDTAIIIKKYGELPIWDYDYCKGCGICADVCPTQAIEMVRESEEKNR